MLYDYPDLSRIKYFSPIFAKFFEKILILKPGIQGFYIDTIEISKP